MATNLLVALRNIAKYSDKMLVDFSQSSNRMNSRGEALELYIKDAFCGSFGITDNTKKSEKFSENFSYFGNRNNPPDIMIRGGDAIEVKKIEGSYSGIALNSSYPKDVLYSDNPMITESCRSCEEWTEKDILYSVGVVQGGELKSLWFVYGNCYAAEKNVYERVRNTISLGLNDLPGVEISETRELGRVNRVDPLGITYLRVRGMWHIENPSKVFEYISQSNVGDVSFSVRALLLKEKYDSFPDSDKIAIEGLQLEGVSVKDVKIKSPNNPVKMLDAKLISFAL